MNCDTHDTNMAKIILKINQTLPSYHRRQMRNDFVEKFKKLGKATVGIAANELYQETFFIFNALWPIFAHFRPILWPIFGQLCPI